jgi:cobalt-zinc-cadmium efflux system protein
MSVSLHTHAHTHLGDSAKQTRGRLILSLTLTAGFVVFEAAAGVFSNSLALLTDAAHNLTDVIALALSLYAVWLAMKPSSALKTYGYHRAGILVALVNSTTLVIISLWIFYSAYLRFQSPPEVKSGVLIVVGLIAFVINLVTALMVMKGSEHDLNLRSTFLHLMGDVLSTLGAVFAGVIIFFTNWYWLDPLVSVFIGMLILWNAWGILKETVDILLESTPRDVNVDEMIREMKQVPGVLGVHDLHVWSITQSMRTMSAHILTDDIAISAGREIQNQLNGLLADNYHITHATLQLECINCQPCLYCDMNEVNHQHAQAET